MKKFFRDIVLAGLTKKQRIIAYYCVLSLCFLLSLDSNATPFWVIFMAIANFAASAVLIRCTSLHKIGNNGAQL
jgi:hypothetical protein